MAQIPVTDVGNLAHLTEYNENEPSWKTSTPHLLQFSIGWHDEVHFQGLSSILVPIPKKKFNSSLHEKEGNSSPKKEGNHTIHAKHK